MNERDHRLEYLITAQGFEIREILGQAERVIHQSNLVSASNLKWAELTSIESALGNHLTDLGFPIWNQETYPPIAKSPNYPILLARKTL